MLRAKVLAGEITEQEADAILGKSVWQAQGKLPEMWPTPTVQDGKNTGGPSQWERNSDPLNVAVQRVGDARGQKLNPDFVSRLMGYPDGYLDLED